MAELYLVEFKGSRREFFYNTYYHSLKLTEFVIIQAEQGEDMGQITRKIETEVDFSKSSRPRSILRTAGEEDIVEFEEFKKKESDHQNEIDTLVKSHKLEMKVVDVECQFDGSKITYFFTADHRVDFRALVRDLASRHRTRIELRQIGVRDEARRVGGYGICGREQCCTAHIRDFEPISTQHARDQDLSLNPSKISGNCGRLLCCLRYEAAQYVEVKKNFPPIGTRVTSPQGDGVIERIDIFREEAVVMNEDRVFMKVPAADLTVLDKKARAVNRPAPEQNNKPTTNEDESENRPENNNQENDVSTEDFDDTDKTSGE